MRVLQSPTVAAGLITQMTTPVFAVLEDPLGDFAQSEDPDGYAEACSPDGVSPVEPFDGLPYNQRYGAFFAEMEGRLVATPGS